MLVYYYPGGSQVWDHGESSPSSISQGWEWAFSMLKDRVEACRTVQGEKPVRITYEAQRRLINPWRRAQNLGPGVGFYSRSHLDSRTSWGPRWTPAEDGGPFLRLWPGSGVERLQELPLTSSLVKMLRKQAAGERGWTLALTVLHYVTETVLKCDNLCL